MDTYRCWICFSQLSQESNLLPLEDEYIGQHISIFKNTFIVKDVEPFTFCYFTCCNKCIDDYIKIYNSKFRYLKLREIGINLKYLKDNYNII